MDLDRAPWWGGFSERMVKSVKRCLRKMLGNFCLTYDELLTSLIEVEAVINLYGPLSQIVVEEVVCGIESD